MAGGDDILDVLLSRVRAKRRNVERSELTQAQRNKLDQLQRADWKVQTITRTGDDKSVNVSIDSGVFGLGHQYIAIGPRGGMQRHGTYKRTRVTLKQLGAPRLRKVKPVRERKPRYYDWSPTLTLAEVHRRWQHDGQKVYDRSMPAYYTPAQLWPHREYTWTRKTARGGIGRFQGRQLPGPQKWDELRTSLLRDGWDARDPAHVYLGKNGVMKVGEGNHRLALARVLGLSRVPVRFFFSQTVTKSTAQQRRKAERAKPKPNPKPKAKAKPKRRRSKKEEGAIDKAVDELEKLLGW